MPDYNNLSTFGLETMENKKEEYSFWTKYRHFAGNEIMLYAVMILGILLGILIFS